MPSIWGVDPLSLVVHETPASSVQLPARCGRHGQGHLCPALVPANRSLQAVFAYDHRVAADSARLLAGAWFPSARQCQNLPCPWPQPAPARHASVQGIQIFANYIRIKQRRQASSQQHWYLAQRVLRIYRFIAIGGAGFMVDDFYLFSQPSFMREYQCLAGIR